MKKVMAANSVIWAFVVLVACLGYLSQCSSSMEGFFMHQLIQ